MSNAILVGKKEENGKKEIEVKKIKRKLNKIKAKLKKKF